MGHIDGLPTTRSGGLIPDRPDSVREATRAARQAAQTRFRQCLLPGACIGVGQHFNLSGLRPAMKIEELLQSPPDYVSLRTV